MLSAGLLLPAALAGAVAIGVTVAIERLGGRVGGLLGSVPTTIVPASLGIAAATDPSGLAAAMGGVPAGMVVNALFLWSWRALPPRLPAWALPARLGLMAAISLSLWLACATLMVLGTTALREAGVPPLLTGAVLALCLVAMGVAACWRLPPAPRGGRRVPAWAVLARGALAAVAIAAAIALTRVAGPLAAGVASVFPAIFLTAMVSLWWSQGEAVQAGAVGPILLGSSAVSAYALAAAWTLPHLGPGWGAGAAWILAVLLVTLPASRWLRRRPGPPSGAASGR